MTCEVFVRFYFIKFGKVISIMQLVIELSNQRGRTRTSTLDSRHSFSFGGYFNPKRIRLGSLKIFNDHVMSPGRDFGLHQHKNLELITLVLAGTLTDANEKGQGQELPAGSLYQITSGTGYSHSEENRDPLIPAHYLQIGFAPSEKDLKPRSSFCSIPPLEMNQWTLWVSDKSRKDSSLLTVNQDIRIYGGKFTEMSISQCSLAGENRAGFVFILQGHADVEGHNLQMGDSITVTHTESFTIEALRPCTILWIDVPIDPVI